MTDLLKYFSQRYGNKILALVAVVALTHPLSSYQQHLTLFCLIYLFRLFDDLCDLKWDRIHHPERILTQTRNFTSFVALIFCWISVFFFTMSLQQILVLALFTALWLLIMRFLPHDKRLLRSLVGLIKYPVFLMIVHGTGALLPGLMIYLAMLVFDLYDDKNLHYPVFAQFSSVLLGLLGLLAMLKLELMAFVVAIACVFIIATPFKKYTSFIYLVAVSLAIHLM
ncbi:MAG: hypothetical protein COW00_16045 [Bdellovibrio sp. CG12_big_fil_rev_8_21_14_0_65_39_13]|nr:MAG: hypothetical protein COW78_02425 [Bdellovibrio sp. CG22_combo_CG10-13_8_21_14_all_39_27]PIQ58355.1 MAG: hypothetical protein COW00_16045 [Bdellovibrio sp. CG12_big_fil_rev_8_21_14_0_65_39_13]PIR35868.1 MAG: hypothetical protein COV37_06625 [Bdellovibrio sp. CG11_big_fil_rev_8_21_14_0_20_39_38]